MNLDANMDNFLSYARESRANWTENKLDHMSNEAIDALIDRYVCETASLLSDFDAAFPFVTATVVLIEYRAARASEEVKA